MRWSAVLLAGGKSSRMGCDKAFLQIDGAPLWRRQLNVLEELAPERIFIAGPPHEEWSDYEILRDAIEAAGPLGGLTSAFRACPTALLLALAVDLPNMTANFLHNLLIEDSGIVPQLNGRFEPLVGIYPKAALPIAETHLSCGEYSMQKFVQACVAQGLVRPAEIPASDARLFTNLNTPEDMGTLSPRHIPPRQKTRATRATSSPVEITRHETQSGLVSCTDEVAVEEPLEIRVEGKSVAVVMRTPGHDRELAAGFALAEGLVRDRGDIFEIHSCLTTESTTDNVVNIALTDPNRFDESKFSRRVFTSSSCGICSKATIEAALQQFPPIKSAPPITAKTLLELPDKLAAAQETFQRTGGLHACALFNSARKLVLIREDVGRHNALDKLIGHQLLAEKLPLGEQILLLSGRVSFEMIQKALAAGIAIIAAISAPTSLAVEFARANNQTLVGFLRGETMNVYSGRVVTS